MTPITLRYLCCGHTFIFRYDPDDVAGLIAAMAKLAENPDSPFNWFDASVLAYQAERRQKQEAIA